MDASHLSTEQTPAQWGVRWNGLVATALLVLSVPLVHLGWHGLLGHEQPPFATRSQTPAPALAWAALRDGSWMLAEERHLREASPVVWWLRGTWNEALLGLGLSQGERVHVGADGWLFLTADVTPDAERFRALAPARRSTLCLVRDRVRAAGAELFVMVVPDKSRLAPRAGAEAAGARKAPLYGLLLAEFAELGIPSADLVAGMRAAAAAAPDEGLFYRTDTHWRPFGALAAGKAVAPAVEALPLAGTLPPRTPLRLGARRTQHAVGDLATMLGICVVDRLTPDGQVFGQPASLFAQRFVEPFDSYALEPPDPALRAAFDGTDAAAAILLVGTSYADSGGHLALQFALGRPIHLVQENGATGLVAMQRALDELADPAGPRPRLVIWEIVERGFLEGGWREPAAPRPRARSAQVILCRGSICAGTGGTLQCAPTRRFLYRVRPSTAGNAVTKVEIGTDIANLASYTNLCAPPGWTLVSIDSLEGAHDVVFTPQGTMTDQSGHCPFVMHWAGPGMTTAFELGFDMRNVAPHDVTWKSWASGIADAISNWSFAVGTGQGPVHGPQPDEDPPWRDPPQDH